MAPDSRTPDQRRGAIAGLLKHVEYGLYVAVAVALALAGAALFIYAFVSFAGNVGEESFGTSVLGVLDSMLLVFIVTELIHTVRAVIAENVLMTEPFLIVGIVAAIRRLILISAEAKDLIGKPEFGDAMLEMGILVGAVLGLGLTIFLVRHTQKTEPRPAHEPERGG